VEESTSVGAEWGIVVVHGVGSPRPGETLRRVCDAIQQARGGVALAATPRRISDGAGGHVDVIDGTAGTQRIRAVEAYWGDISLVRNRLPTLIRALFINLFGLRYICQRALAESPLPLRALCVFPFQVMRGVIVPLHLLAFGIAAPIGVRTWLWEAPGFRASGSDHGYLTTYDSMFLALCAAYAVVGIVLAVWMKESGAIRSRPWDVALSFAAFAILSALFSGPALLRSSAHLPALHDWLQQHSLPEVLSGCLARHPDRPKVDTITILAMLGQRETFGEGLCLWITSSTPITEGVFGVGRYLAINELIGDTAFYVIAANIVFLLLAVALYAIAANGTRRRSATLALTATMLFVVLMAIVLQPVDLAIKVVQHWGANAVNAYWYELLFILWLLGVVGAAAIAIVYRGRVVAQDSRLGAHVPSAQKPYPRLIVSNVLQCAVIGCTVGLIAAFSIAFTFGRIPKELYVTSIEWRLAAPALLVLVVALLLSSAGLRAGMNFVMDVVGHFSEPRRGFPVRREIGGRLFRAIDALLGDRACRQLLVVAHSQGTVILLDALVHEMWERHLKGRVDTLTLITFGSPWTHIYQHYFAADYPEVPGPWLQALADAGEVRWFNVFRLDDVIGTQVKMSTVDFPVNVPIGFGGHVRYWEKEVLSTGPLCGLLP
jgi:hypothetical protein